MRRRRNSLAGRDLGESDVATDVANVRMVCVANVAEVERLEFGPQRRGCL